MTWEDVENAVQAAIVAASGYPSAKVVWRYQNKNAPPEDYVSIAVGAGLPIGQDRILTTFDPGRARGQEYKVEARGDREVLLEVEVFTNVRLGTKAAQRVASKIGDSLSLPSIRGKLAKVGFTPFDPQRPTWIPDVPNTDFRGRSLLEVRCYAPLFNVFEYTTYIERILGTATVIGTKAGSSSYPFDSAAAPAQLLAVSISPTSFGVGTGATQQMTATGFYGNGSTKDLTTAVAWSSSAPGVATVDSASLAGRVTGVAPGAATISASLSGVTTSTTVTVS